MKALQKREFLQPLEIVTARGKKLRMMHPYKYHPILIDEFKKQYKGHHPTIQVHYVRFIIFGNEVHEVPLSNRFVT